MKIINHINNKFHKIQLLKIKNRLYLCLEIMIHKVYFRGIISRGSRIGIRKLHMEVIPSRIQEEND